MKTQLPLVSVIIPVHNGAKYLENTLKSVFEQRYPHMEIWAIDNGSSDSSRQVIEKFPQVKYKYLEIANVACARNEGINLSNGEYIAFLDQDDEWVPDKINTQVEYLQNHPNAGAVVGWQFFYLEPGYLKPHWLKQAFLNEAQPGFLPSALMVRRETFVKGGVFDPTYLYASDSDWFFRLKRLEIFVGEINKVLVHRKIHSNNQSNHCDALQKELLLMMHKNLRQKRGNECLSQ